MDAATLAGLLALPDLPAGLARVEAGLDRALESGHEAITDPARRVVLSGGKRLRPALTLASAAAVGGTGTDGVVHGATAVELVQAGSLVHDDIMDAATERRGVATVNAAEGPSAALLVGDFLLARAGQLAAQVSREVAASLSQAIADLCVGQSLEVGTLFDPDRTVDSYEQSIEGKTAALFRTACEIGALAVEGPSEAVAALSAYGTAFGMAFQIIDDVLDLVSTAEALGKPVGNDVREGVYSLPVLLALAGPDGESLRTRLGRLPSDDDVAFALAFVRSSPVIKLALDEARRYNDAARDSLAPLPDTPTRDGLARLPDAYLEWVVGDKAPGLALATPG